VRDEAIAAEAVRSLASHQYGCAAEGPAVQDTRSLQRKPVAVRRVASLASLSRRNRRNYETCSTHETPTGIVAFGCERNS
jgi:hypothetical protein